MPSPEIVRRALEQIRKRPANHDYFFSRLTSAEWIGPLDDVGLFSSPPPALRKGDTISFPVWPESQYLARMASNAPEAVVAVMMKLPDTDNMRVHEDLARAAAKLPAVLAAKWARKEVGWVEQQERLYFLLPGALGELIEHLAVSGELQASLRLAKAVLSVSFIRDPLKAACGRFHAWKYKQLLQRNFPKVMRQTEVQGLVLLCDLLEDGLAGASEGSDEDYSWIWRPAIEPNSQNHRYGDIRDALIDGIRDGALDLVERGIEAGKLVQILLSRRRPVFKRIALHVLTEHHEHQAAKDLVCERENFFDHRIWHEYSRLLRSVFSSLDDEIQSTVLGWIEAGPLREARNEEDEVERRKRKSYWQAKRLYGLRGQLPNEWEQRYLKIVAELGEPKHPDFMSYTTTTTGPTSPKEARELEDMSAEDIASFLKSWEPSQGWPASEPEELGQVLQKVVAESVDRFIGALDSFRNVEPTYARALVQGLCEAVKTGHPIGWSAVTEYLLWVTRQPRSEVRESSGRLDQDPHWGWARKAVASLLSIAFEKGSIGISHRDVAWRIVDAIADDPDPTREDDEKSTMDPATRSINTTRGEALHAIVQYALWVRRELTEEGMESHQIDFDMSSIPEVLERLERHLEPTVEPSPAIRAVFGQWFPWLLLLDESWAEAKVEAIFPLESPELCDASWLTYLVFCSVYNGPFRVLRRQYDASVDRLQSEGDVNSGGLGRPWERLGEHLLIMVGRGVLDWSDEDGLVKRFFENASLRDASEVIASVGRSLQNATNTVPDEVVERFRRLWEEIASWASENPTERAQLLRPFGWWFSSVCFDAQWSFDQLARVLESAGGLEPDFMVMQRLADIASEHPARCLDALKEIVRQDLPGWSLLDMKDNARSVLRAGLATDVTKQDAVRLIHQLGARGHLKFRSLLEQ